VLPGLRHHVRLALVVVPVVALTIAASASVGSAAVPTTTRRTKHRNIVFVLTDDLSWNLITKRFAPHIVQLEKRGETFDHYFVADSLCCPSRSSIFTGEFPHDTQVVTNLPPYGGFQKFQSRHLDQKTFALALHGAGYRTSMLGKYLNGYGDPTMTPATAPLPPGWDDWHVSNLTGYAEYDYLLNDNGAAHFYGTDQYGVDVLNRDARAFIVQHAHQPFMVEAATFAPHAPYTPAKRNAADFPGLREPRDPSFNTNNVDPPAWLGTRGRLGPVKVAHVDNNFRKRAQSVEAVDKLVADVEATLRTEKLLKTTDIVFSSDNGYHLGQHRLARGKQTAFDTDIRVPLIIAGPGIAHGRVVHAVAQNVDLAPTFAKLAGVPPPTGVDGRSLMPALRKKSSSVKWRTLALVEHHGGNTNPADPDFEGVGSDPTTYEAIRISSDHLAGFKGHVEAVYVEYQDTAHEKEYYDIAHDPYERRNIASKLTERQRTTLHRVLVALERCHGTRACWQAALPG